MYITNFLIKNTMAFHIIKMNRSEWEMVRGVDKMYNWHV